MPAFTFSNSQTPGGAMIPKYSATGLITGYTSSGNQALKAAPGSVGAGMLPVLNSSGQTVGYSSGTGHDHLPVAGAPGAAPAEDPNSSVSLLHQVKSQPIADAAAGLGTATAAAATATTKSFKDYLAEAHDQNAKNAAQIETDRKTLNDTSAYEQQLKDINAQYSAASHGTNQQIIDSNNQYQQTQQKTVQQLAEENARYEAAAQAVAGQAVAAANGQNKLYQAASGTPTSDSGDMRARAIQAYLGVNTPLQADLSNRRLNQITNVMMPLNREYNTNRLQQLEGFQQPMDQSIASMGTASANTVESLKASLAGRSLNESIAYMQSMGIPFQVMQQVLSGNINNLAGLSAIDQGNTFYGLAQPYNNPNISLPTYTGAPVGRPQNNQPNAPVNYGPQPVSNPGNGAPTGGDQNVREYYRQQTGFYPEQDPNFSQGRYNQALAIVHPSGGKPMNSTYPANTGTGTGGAYVDGQYFPAGNAPTLAPTPSYLGDVNSNPYYYTTA